MLRGRLRPSTGAGGGRGRSLGNSRTTATGPTGRTRLQHRQTSASSFLPSTWFNMRESKCTIQNLKTSLWSAPPPALYPRRRSPGRGGGDAVTSMPHLGGCSHTHNMMLLHNCFVVCHLQRIWKGPSPAAPGTARGQGHFSFLAASVVSSLEAPGTSLGVELSS